MTLRWWLRVGINEQRRHRPSWCALREHMRRLTIAIDEFSFALVDELTPALELAAARISAMVDAFMAIGVDRTSIERRSRI